MKEAHKVLLLFGLFAVIIFHVVCVFIYANPLVHSKNKSDYWVEYYVYPFFHQNWNLFAPPPSENYALYVSYDDNTGIKKEELFQKIIVEHQTNRLKGYEAIVLALSNCCYYFEKSVKEQNSINGPIKNNLYFTMLQHLTVNYLEWKNKKSISMTELIFVSENIHTKKKRVYYTTNVSAISINR